MDKKEKDIQEKEGQNMPPVVARKQVDITSKLDRISSKAKTLTGNGRMIELDPKNPSHREWFEADKYKGK